jgi:hypothetical protein
MSSLLNFVIGTNSAYMGKKFNFYKKEFKLVSGLEASIIVPYVSHVQ